jgi:hypothetical protein
VVFTSNGGTDTILGLAREQDVFQGGRFNDQRTGGNAPAATDNEAPNGGSEPAWFGATDGFELLFAGLGRHAIRERLAGEMSLPRHNRNQVETNDLESGVLMEQVLPAEPLSRHDVARTMFEMAEGVQPLDNREMVLSHNETSLF